MSKPHLNLVRSTLASLSMVLLLFLIPLLSAASAPASATATFAPAGHLETSFLVPYGRLAVGHTGILFSFCPAADNWYCSHSYRSRDEGSMWEMLNSVSGASVNVNDVVASPPGSPEDILFWGVTSWSGTLRISSPDGRTWRVPQQPPEGWVDRFVLSPGYATDGTLYAAMSVEPFLWRSTDWGDHWQGIASPGASRIEHLAASPLLPTDQTLFAALYDDTLWRSTDAGDTWQPADSGLGASALNPIRDVAVVTTDDGGLAALAALSDTLHISFDLGDSWAPRPTVQLRSLYVAPDWATSHTLFAIDHEWWSLYKSTDLGQTWLMAGPATVRDLAFSPDYLDDHTLYAGASQDVWVSRDGGATWTASPPRPMNPWDVDNIQMQIVAPPDLDQDNLLFALPRLPSNPTDLAFRSTDGGRTWHEIALPMPGAAQYLAISPTYAQDHTVLAVVDDTLFKSTDAGDHWVEIGTSPTGYSPVLVPSPAYAQDHTLFAYEYYSGVYRSEDDGQTWSPIDGTQYVTDLDISPGYPGDSTLFVCRYNDGIFRSADGGSTWLNIQDQPGIPSWSIALSPAFLQDDTLFAVVTGSSAGGAYRSSDRGDTWTPIGAFNYFVNVLAVSPRFAQDQTLMIGTEGHAPYLSEDAGDTWNEIQGIPGIGGYGRSSAGLLTYEHGRLLPLATTPDAVYRYWWPDLDISPAGLQVCLEPGAIDPVTVPLRLEPTDLAPVPWEATTTAAWLSTAPVSGTLPDTLDVTIDPDLAGDNSRTEVQITVWWSLRQHATYAIPVFVSSDCRRAYLPLIVR